MKAKRGTASIPEAKASRPPTPEGEIDRAIEDLQENAERWAGLDLADRRRLLDRLVSDYSRVVDEWVAESLEAKGIGPDEPMAAEEWLGGPYAILRNLNLLRRSLAEISALGRPSPPGRIDKRADGQLVVEVFPSRVSDGVFFPGITAELWMEKGVSLDDLPSTQASFYREGPKQGGVALVLGAGNVSSIGPMDVLYKLFVEGQVVVLKMNPVNAYVGPLIARGFACLVDEGYLRIIYGGASQGAFLCEHEGVQAIHITGSDKTHDAIVFGTGDEGERRKAARKPRNTKPVSSELGNVSPVIVVPGFWSQADLDFQAANLVSMLVNNAGFNCNATRLIVQWAPSLQRAELMDAIRRIFAKVRTRKAYYPGAGERFDAFLAEHPETELFGIREGDRLPWAMVPDLDPDREDDICFSTEAFCGLFGEVAIHADTVVDYIEKAVEFANERVWGTLSASLIVHPAALRDPEVAEAFEKAVADLRYGSIGINHWAGLSYALVSTSWGAFPGHEIDDIQSGRGVVHNTLMYEKIQKSVVRGPFRMRPLPPWFATHRNAHRVARQLVRFEANGSLTALPGLLAAALTG